MAATTRSPQPGSNAPVPHHPAGNRGWGGGTKLGIAAGVLLLPLVWLVTRPMGFGDSASYLHVAQHPGRFGDVVPYAYRVGAPYLAAIVNRMSPLGLVGAFRLLAAVGFVAVVALIVGWAKIGLKLATSTAITLGVLYAFSLGGIYNMHHAVQVGVWEHLFLLAGIMSVWHRRLGWLLVIGFVGAWFKESAFLLVPAELLMVCASRESWRAAVTRTSAVLAVTAVPFLLLHTGLALPGGPGFGGYLEAQRTAGGYWSQDYANVTDFIEKTIITFAGWWPLIVAGFATASRRSRWLLWLVPLFLVQSVTATTFERVFASAFPVFVPLCGAALDRIDRRLLWPACGVGCMATIWLSWDNTYQTLAVAALVTALACVVVLYRRESRRGAQKLRRPTTKWLFMRSGGRTEL